MMNNIRARINAGFTLIEVLIALLIFTIGLLGMGLQLSKNMSATINKEVHSSVMQLAMQSIEPLNQAILNSPDAFKSALFNLSTAGTTPAFGTNNSEKSNFNISIDRATDSSGNSLLATDSSLWLPPYSLVLNIEYKKDDTNKLNFKSTHVFVPPLEKI